jgi:L-phenylalanine/L-methionine N-acetyltransferase
MAEIVIRRMEPGDAEGVALCFRSRSTAAGTLQNPYPSVADWQKRLSGNDPQRHYAFVALDGTHIVGHAGLHQASPNPRRAHAWSVGIALVDEWQGRGLGTRLMQTLIDLADNWLGALRLELTVYCDNARAIALYERFGFVIEGTLRAYSLREGQYVDTLAMARMHPHPPQLPVTATSEPPR